MNQTQTPNQAAAPQFNLNEKRAVTAADVPFTLKARYIGTGFVMGVVAAPVVNGSVGGLSARFNGILERLTGQVKGLADNGTDVLARAKDLLQKESRGKGDAVVKRKKAPEAKSKGHGSCSDHDHA